MAVTVADLQAFADAWNRHDVEALMRFTRPDGSRVEVDGCDLFTFRDGRIKLKDSYRKSRPPLAAR